MIRRIALVLSFVVMLHAVAPLAHAIQPGPALLEKAKRASGCRKLLTELRDHRQYLRIRTLDERVISGYVIDVSSGTVAIHDRDLGSREVAYESIDQIQVNHLTRRQVGMLLGVGILITAVVVATQTK